MSLQVPCDQFRIQLQRGREYHIGEVTQQFLSVEQLKLKFPLAQLKMQDNQIIAGKQQFTVKKDVRDYIFDSIRFFNQGNRIPTSTRLFIVTDLIEKRKVEVAMTSGFFIIKMMQSDHYYRASAALLQASYADLVLKVSTNTVQLSEFEFESEKDITDFVQLMRAGNIKVTNVKEERVNLNIAPLFDCGFTKYYTAVRDANFVNIAPYGALEDVDAGVVGDSFVLLQEGIEVLRCALESVWSVNFFDKQQKGDKKEAASTEAQGSSEDDAKSEKASFFAQIKLCDNSRLLLGFESQLARQRFSQFILDSLTQRFITPQLQYYEFDPRFSLDLPFSPCSGKLIQGLFQTLDSQHCSDFCGLLLENDARTLPVISKRTEMLGILLKQIQLSRNSAEISAYFDLLRKMMTSRTLFISIIRDYATQVRDVLKLHIKREGDEYVVTSAILFLRSILSYQWDPQVIGVGQSVSGISQVYSVGIFSQIYLGMIKKPVKQYFLYKLEMQAFEDLDVQETSSFKASIGLHSIFQQGKNYLPTRHAAELDNRKALFAPDRSILPLLGSIIAYFDEVKLPLVQTCILGIIEDILVTKSQIEQHAATTTAQSQPPGRSELFTLIYECYSVFVGYSSKEVQGLRIACCIIIYYMLNENILIDQFKEEISEHFLTSGAILVHLQTIMQDAQNQQLKSISLALLGSLYFVNKNVQNLFHKIFPTSMLDDFRVYSTPYIYDYTGFQSLQAPTMRSIYALETRIATQKYSINIVWDQNIVQSIIEQIDHYLNDFIANVQMTDGNVALNYELIKIRHNGVSLRKYSQFDIDIDGYFLSQFLTQDLQDGMNAIGSDLTAFYCGKSDRKLFCELVERIGSCDAQKVTDLFYRAYSQIPHDRQVKAALIYAIQSMILACQVHFDYVRELATEVTVQIQQESYQLVLYLLCLLECAGYQVDPKDMLRRNYFNQLSEHFLLRFLVYRVLPLLAFDQAECAIDSLLGPQLDLIHDQTYGNLVLVALRLINCSIQQQSNKDYDNNILYPSPSIYSLLANNETLSIFIALLVVCNRSFVAEQSAGSQQIAIQCFQLLSLLVREMPSVAQQLVELGFLEIILGNSFGENVNCAAFELVKLISQHSEVGRKVLQQSLPIPFCTYIDKYDAEAIARTFVSQQFLSLNIIWTANARTNLRQQLEQFEAHVWDVLATLSKQQIVQTSYQNPLQIGSYDGQNSVFKFTTFASLDDHPHIELDDELRRYEQHRSGNVYLQLIDMDNFLSVQESFDSRPREELIEQYEEMLRKFQEGISVAQCIEYLKAILHISEFKELFEEDFVFESLTDYSANYIHTIVMLLIRSSQQQFASLITNVRQFQKDESAIRQSLEKYISSTGGSGKSVLRSKRLSDPSQILEKRKQIATVYLKLIIVIFKIMKTLTKTIKAIPSEFDSYKILTNMLQLAQFLESLELGNQFEQLSGFVPDPQSAYYQKVTEFSLKMQKVQADLRQAIIDLLPLYCADLLENPQKPHLVKSFGFFVQLFKRYAHLEMFSDNKALDQMLAIFVGYCHQGVSLDGQTRELVDSVISLLAIICRFRPYCKMIVEGRLFAFLFIFMFEGNDAAAEALTLLSQNVSNVPAQVDAFLRSISFLGYAYKHIQQPAQLRECAKQNVYTECFVYTTQLQEEIQNFLWQQALGEIDYNITFDEAQYLPKEFMVCGFYLGSMLSIFLGQFGDQIKAERFALPNFSAQIQQQSNPSEIFMSLSAFLLAFYRSRFQLEEVQVDSALLKQLSDADCAVFTAIISLIFIHALSQDYLMQQLYQKDDAVKIFMSFAVGHASSSLQEYLAELALLTVSAIGCKNKLVHQNAKYLLLLATNNITMQPGMSSYSLSTENNLSQLFQSSQYQLEEAVDQFYGFHYSFMNRQCYAQFVLTQLIQQGPIMYLNAVELMLFLQYSPQFAAQDPDQYENNQYILKTSARLLQALCPSDVFLQNMLQTPLLLSFIKGVPVETCTLISSDIKTPNFVWNQQCSADLLQFLDQLFQNQLLHDLLVQKGVNLNDYVFQKEIAYIRDTYTSQDFYLGHTFLNVYNENSLKRETFLANPSEFLSAIMSKFTQELASAENAVQFILYLQALTNFVTQQKEFIPHIVQHERFEQLIVLLFIENQYINLLPYQISQQTLKLSGILLESILHIMVDFPISKQTFHDLVIVFFSSMPSINFALDRPVDQPPFSLQNAEKALIALSAFITILLQNPALRIDFCSMRIGNVQGESVIAPFLSYQLIIQESVPRFIKISQICAITQLLERSVDFTSLFQQKFGQSKYHEFVATILDCQVGFKNQINGGAKESVDDQVPVPNCEIYKEWSAETIAKFSMEGFDQQDCENCLAGFIECRRISKSSAGLINGIPRNQISVDLADMRKVFCARASQLSAVQLCLGDRWTEKYRQISEQYDQNDHRM